MICHIVQDSKSNILQYTLLSQPKTQTKHQVKEMSTSQKRVVLASAALGMTPVMCVLAKNKGFSLDIKKILKTPIKDWALFKFEPEEKSIQFKTKEIISVASGSILGGFVGGVLVDDKSNLKAKKREILTQALGNVLIPVGCVSTGATLYKKYQDIIEGSMPQFKNATSKTLQHTNTVLKKIPNAFCTLLFLATGIFAGNKTSNFLNDKIYKQKVDRSIKPSDFAPHIDDLCMATTMMNEGSSLGARLGRIIPLALLIPGYETGTAIDKGE